MIIQSDVSRIPLGDNSVDLVFCSPPYEDARTYGIDFDLAGQDWVDWAVPRFIECLRVCRGLVAWVIEGRTSKFRWSATPSLFMADLHRAGVKLRKPPIYHRVGIPGSGGPDWLRNDYEFIVCASDGKLPWSDNTAMGGKPVYPVGGAMTNQMKNGRKVACIKRQRREDGSVEMQGYNHPDVTNPGNVIKCRVGGGAMGSDLAHENEACFPEKLAEFFVLSFCPPGGRVLDPFSGSGTTAYVAKQHGRLMVAGDIRFSQCQLSERRTSAVQLSLESLKSP